MSQPIVVSHAACAGHAPENTLAGLRLALHMGAHAIEIDVHLSADGIPVLIHDDSVDRTTDGRGAVASLTLAELRELRAGARSPFETFRGEKVPTLAEALELTRGRVLLVIEIKPPHIEEAAPRGKANRGRGCFWPLPGAPPPGGSPDAASGPKARCDPTGRRTRRSRPSDIRRPLPRQTEGRRR